MKITQYGENLWQLTRMGMFNCYLVAEADGLTLVDTGMSGSGKGILQAAQGLGLPIKRVTLTHAHADHAGSLDEVCGQLAGVEVALAARTAVFLQGQRDLEPDEPQAKLRGGFIKSATQPTRKLQSGDMLGSLRVVAAPGHTPDQIAFYDERDGTLIAGDAFQTMGGTAVAGIMRWSFPFPAMATWHLPTALATAVALRALNPTRLAVGHGRVLADPLPAMVAAIHVAEAKVNER
ncbi:MAG TPA: MBL fold metallo-hydrolase [Chloroflexota bacterium]|nr:MBL fold metallo-hydrolase [Chloroflexota bacterium]